MGDAVDADGVEQVAENTEETCVFVATKWGPVFLRVHPDLGHWTKTVVTLNQSHEIAGWYESRVYADERNRLLKNEHSALSMEAHPNAE